MKLFPIAALAAITFSAVAFAGDSTYTGVLETGKSTIRTVSMSKGTTDVHVMTTYDTHNDNRLSCEFIDVAAGNVVVLREKNVQTCNCTSVNFSTVKLGIKITNVNDHPINYEIGVSTRK